MPYDYVSDEYWKSLIKKWRWYLWAGIPTNGWHYIKDITQTEYDQMMLGITKYLYLSDENKTEGIDKHYGRSANKCQIYRFERIPE